MQITKFNEEDIDWEELEAIGITKAQLEESGVMDDFLNGSITLPLNLDIILLGNDLNVDATLQLTKKGQSLIVNIVCINTEEVEVEMY